MCGADKRINVPGNGLVGSPPRVRSRPLKGTSSDMASGITSACAEQTDWYLTTYAADRDHLRVCGADGTSELDDAALAGSPPRVRSRPADGREFRNPDGITSACAEQTPGDGGPRLGKGITSACAEQTGVFS